MRFKSSAIFLLLNMFAGVVIAKQGLEKSNYYRQLHGVPDFQISDEIADNAQRWADYLASTERFKHSPTNLGENLAMYLNDSEDDDKFFDKAVNSWYSEIDLYDFNNPGFSISTGHFTQVIWKSSKMIGSGIASSSRYVYIVTQYSPSGNYRNQFQDNVLPLVSLPSPIIQPLSPATLPPLAPSARATLPPPLAPSAPSTLLPLAPLSPPTPLAPSAPSTLLPLAPVPLAPAYPPPFPISHSSPISFLVVKIPRSYSLDCDEIYYRLHYSGAQNCRIAQKSTTAIYYKFDTVDDSVKLKNLVRFVIDLFPCESTISVEEPSIRLNKFKTIMRVAKKC